jgi:pseudaminic acid cytidylyltransferase
VKLAVIPARGGSKRIPKKNVRPFAGQPIMAYSIRAASDCMLFDRIIVSTDDPEIGAVARKFGAEVPFLRPPSLADDYVGTNAVVKHALETLPGVDRNADYACCIYATAPFLEASYLREGYERLAGGTSLFAFSVTTFEFPIQRALRLANGGVAPFWPENAQSRSQDLTEAYHDAGQFYWGRASAFLDERPLYAPHSIPIILPRWLVQDIDTPEDWARAELMHRAWHGAT